MRRNGFTLIEIIVSVSILLLLSGLFIANYNGFNDSQTVKKAASDVVTNLQAARTSASAGVKPTGCDTLVGYTVNFPTDSTYTAQANCLVGAAGEAKIYTLPPGVTFSPLPTPITFYALDRGASADQTIAVAGNGVISDISVSASGVVSALSSFSCNRCSYINGCERTQFQSLTRDCVQPIPDSTVIRTTDCSCPQISGGNNSRCTTECL